MMKFEYGYIIKDKQFPLNTIMWGKLHISDTKCYYMETKINNSDLLEKAINSEYQKNITFQR